MAGGHTSNTGLRAIRAHGPSLSRGFATWSSCSIWPCLGFPYCNAGMSVPMDFSGGLIEVGFAKHGVRACHRVSTGCMAAIAPTLSLNDFTRENHRL